MRARWEAAKGEPPANGKAEQSIAVRIDKALLKRCTALAKKKRLSRDELIARTACFVGGGGGMTGRNREGSDVDE